VSLACAGLWAFGCWLALRGHRRLAAMSGMLATLGLGMTFGALFSILGASLGLPLIDRQLAAVDAALGIDHRALAAWLAARPLLCDVLMQCYQASVPLVAMAGTLLAVLGQFDRLRRFLVGFAASLAATVVIAAIIPAIGTYAHLGLRDAAAGGLPAGAGDYHLAYYAFMRSGASLDVGPLNVVGIVTFPSFHAVMALLVAYACWTVPAMRWPGVAYGGATLFATVPLGGHYVIDIVAGALILAVVMRLAGERQAAPTGGLALAPAE
jgi:hypothetical protein